MTARDSFFKWLCYALGVLPVWILETMVLNRLPVWGVIPVLLPLAGAAVSLWEGPFSGSLFGLFLGLFADGLYPGTPGGMTLGLALLGCLCGLLAQYGLRQNYLGYLLCSALSLTLIDLVRVAWSFFSGLAPLPPLALLAGKEILWSLVFTIPIYPLFKWIHSRVGRKGPEP